MFTVDIDTGGTMTDALVSNGSEIRAFKVDTTPHDYTVSFRECRECGVWVTEGSTPRDQRQDTFVVLK